MAASPDSGPVPAALTTSSLRTDAVRDPLAAILGHAQHLKRRFLNGEPVSPDDYLTALATIGRSVWAIEGYLRVLEYGNWRLGEQME